VIYRDDWNSEIHIVWKNVELAATLWQRIEDNPLFRAGLLILFPILVLCLLLRQEASLRRWSPMFVPLLEASSARLWPDFMRLTATDVVIAAGLALIVTLCAALLS